MARLCALFEGSSAIPWTVENLPNGIRTITESANPELRRGVVSHVTGMIGRVDQGRGLKCSSNA